MCNSKHQFLNPRGWKTPNGYSNGVLSEGKFVFVGGLVGWNANEEFETDDFVEQVAQTLRNIVAVLKEANASPLDLVRMTWYITDKNEYLPRQKELGNVYREIIGRHFPAMALVQVAALIEEGAKVEIEATAVISQS